MPTLEMVLSSHNYVIGDTTMYIIPIKDFKDTAKISALCHEVDEPVHVTKNGYPDLVVMSSEVYEQLHGQAEAYQQMIISRLLVSVDDLKRGEKGEPAKNVIDELRGKYGL